MASEIRVRERDGASIRFCSRACYRLSVAKLETVPAPPRVKTFDERAYQMAYHPAWRERNAEHVRAESAKWRRENPEKRREAQRRYRETHKEQIAAASMARRARQKSNKVTPARLAMIMSAAEGHCTYCGQPSDRLEFDHVEPIIFGGKHVVKNLLPACRSCNSSKGDKDIEDWLFDRHGIAGLSRALVMLEQRKRWVSA